MYMHTYMFMFMHMHMHMYMYVDMYTHDMCTHTHTHTQVQTQTAQRDLWKVISPKGLVVRAGPSDESKALGRLSNFQIVEINAQVHTPSRARACSLSHAHIEAFERHPHG